MNYIQPEPLASPTPSHFSDSKQLIPFNTFQVVSPHDANAGEGVSLQGIARRTAHPCIPLHEVCGRDRPVIKGDDAACIARVDAHKLLTVAYYTRLGRQRRRDAVSRLRDVNAPVRLSLELVAARAHAAVPDDEVARRDGPVVKDTMSHVSPGWMRTNLLQLVAMLVWIGSGVAMPLAAVWMPMQPKVLGWRLLQLAPTPLFQTTKSPVEMGPLKKDTTSHVSPWLMRTNLMQLDAIPDWIGRGVAMPLGPVLEVVVVTVVEELVLVEVVVVEGMVVAEEEVEVDVDVALVVVVAVVKVEVAEAVTMPYDTVDHPGPATQ